MNVPLDQEQVKAFQTVKIDELMTKTRYEQRMQDLTEQTHRLIVLALRQKGIYSGSYDLNPEGTCIIERAEKPAVKVPPVKKRKR